MIMPSAETDGGVLLLCCLCSSSGMEIFLGGFSSWFEAERKLSRVVTSVNIQRDKESSIRIVV